MSTTIDQQVVEMRFDNRQFENNLATTVSSLDKLKQSLNLSGASKGLEDVGTAAKGVNLSGLSTAAETVGLKFNAMYTIADQALRNITNSAMNAGKRIVSALTIDPIKTGLSEYETQINAVQTILANTESKGTTLGQVNAALDQLNAYADKTIYNFTEMTRNIGTFTAAGVDLNTSVNAIQGIANLAAVSGSSSQQASTAMYQLSQALSSGTVKLMDWNSVVNAGMGGQVFQDALKETARVHGVAIDNMIKKNGSFRETLQEGWLTADILTETLSHFTMAAEEGSDEWEKYKKSLMDDGYSEEQAESILKLSNTATNAATKVKTATQLWDTLKETAQSGWTQTWEIILGDFGEAKELFSEIYETLSPILEAIAEARNKLLSEGLSSGWKQLLSEGIADEEGYRESIKNVAKDHGIAIDDMIKAEKELDNSLDDNEAFQKVLKKGLADGSISSDMLSDSVTHLADKMRGMTEAERDAAGYTKEHLVQIEALEKGLEDGSISMDEFVKKIQRPSGRENLIQSLMNAFNGLMSVIKPIKEAFSEIFPAITGEQLYSFTERVKEFTAKLTLSDNASKNLKRTFKGLFAVLDIVRQVFVGVFKVITPLFGKVDDLGGGILGVTASIGDWLVALNESIKASTVFDKAMKTVRTAVDKIRKALEEVKKFLQPAIDGIKNFGKEVAKSFEGISFDTHKHLGAVTAIFNVLKDIFVGIGEVFKKFFPYVVQAATGIGNVINDMIGRITGSVQNADADSAFNMLGGGIMAAIGVFIAKFVKSGDGILGAIAALITTVTKSGGDLISSFSDMWKNINGVLDSTSNALNAFSENTKAKSLKEIAIAVAILAAALLVLSFIPADMLTNALFSITALFGELMGSMSIMGKMTNGKDLIKSATALTVLASAILILSIALKIMSTMSWSEMGVGLISLTVGLGALIGAVKLLPTSELKDAAKAIRTMSFAILILSVAIKIMSTMSWSEMGIGLISLVVGLGALVGAVKLLPNDTALRAAGLIGLAAAMVILAAALKIMASMSWSEMAVSLVALGGSLAILALAMNLMTSAIPGALATLIVAPALIILAKALKLMSSMSWSELAVSLVALAGSLLILSIAMTAMMAAIPGALAMLIVAPALISLASALKIMSTMSWSELAVSLVALAGSLIIISLAMTAMIAALPGAAALLVVSAALAILAPVLLALGSMSMGEIGKSLLMLAAAFAVIGLAAYILTPVIPSILGLAGALLLLGLACITIGAGILVAAAGLGILSAALAASGGAIVVFVTSIISLIPYLIEQIGVGIVRLYEVIAGSASAMAEAFKVIVLSVIEALVAAIPPLVEGLMVLITSVLDSLIQHLPTIVVQLITLITDLVTAIAANLGPIVEAIFTLLIAVIDGLAANITRLVEPLANLIVALLQTVVGVVCGVMGSILGPIFDAILAVLGGVADVIGSILGGLSDTFASLFNGIAAVITSIGDTITSILDGIASTIESTLNGIAGVFDSVFNGISTVVTSVGDSIKKVLDGIAGVIDSIGNAALNAGTGFENLANGVKTITDLKLGDMVASLAAVAAGIGDIAAHSGGIKKVGTGMSQLANGVKTSASGFATISKSISSMVGSLSSVQSALTATVAAFASAGSTMSKVGQTLLTNVITGITSQQVKLVTAAKTAMMQFVTAIRSQQVAVKTASLTLISSCVSAISSAVSKFRNVGRDLVRGFANGISANTFLAEAKARLMASAAAEAAKKELDEHSPSKVGYEIGDFFGVGFVNGIAGCISKAYATGTDIASSAKNGLSDAVRRIGEYVDGNMDAQPTIRPILDLSDVESGARAIGGMLGFNPSMGVLANVGGINTMMSRHNQNRGNDDVISAINKLSNELSKHRGDTYQVNGVTYDDGSNVATAVREIVRAARTERRV